MREEHSRYCLGILAVLTGLFVFYASLVPLRYEPRSLAETWIEFQQIPWLHLGLPKRADWVANGLILIPWGGFATGFLNGRRASLRVKLVTFALFAVVHALLVCSIEFVQIWFPPRVLSLNDMLAGYLGGLAGAILWYMTGDRVVDRVLLFARSSRGLPRIVMLAQCCAISLLLYNLLPLDVVLTSEEWGLKVAANRVTWLPFSDWQGIHDGIKAILLGSWAFPLGAVLGLRHVGKTALHQVLVWCVAIELASLPVFHRHTSVTDIIVAAVLGIAGVRLAVPIRRWMDRLDRSITWLLAAIAWTLVILVGFTVRFETFVTDRQTLIDRLGGIFVVPFARAHGSSEWEAAENILIKLLVFGGLAFLLTGWYCRRGTPCPAEKRLRSPKRLAIIVVGIATIGITVELSQAFLIPLVPDITDLLLYSAGAMLGACGFWLLIPERSQGQLF